jgi:hypothetical protein
MPAKIAASIAGKPSGGAGDLDEEIGFAGAFMEAPRRRQRAVGVVRQQRRHFERNPAVDTVRPREGRLEEVGRPRQIGHGQSEKDLLRRLRRRGFAHDFFVIISAVFYGMIEDRRVRGKPGERELVDIAAQGAIVQQSSRDIVEPETLSDVMQRFCGFHDVCCLGSHCSARPDVGQAVTVDACSPGWPRYTGTCRRSDRGFASPIMPPFVLSVRRHRDKYLACRVSDTGGRDEKGGRAAATSSRPGGSGGTEQWQKSYSDESFAKLIRYEHGNEVLTP